MTGRWVVGSVVEAMLDWSRAPVMPCSGEKRGVSSKLEVVSECRVLMVRGPCASKPDWLVRRARWWRFWRAAKWVDSRTSMPVRVAQLRGVNRPQKNFNRSNCRLASESVSGLEEDGRASLDSPPCPLGAAVEDGAPGDETLTQSLIVYSSVEPQGYKSRARAAAVAT